MTVRATLRKIGSVGCHESLGHRVAAPGRVPLSGAAHSGMANNPNVDTFCQRADNTGKPHYSQAAARLDVVEYPARQ